MIGFVQSVVINQIRPVYIQKRAERKAIIPGGGKVAHLDVLIACSLPLTPEQKALLRRLALLVNVRDCKAQDEGPDETQHDLPVPINDILRANVCHLYALASDKVERLVDILEALHAQLGIGGIFAQGLVAQDFEKVDQANAV